MYRATDPRGGSAADVGVVPVSPQKPLSVLVFEPETRKGLFGYAENRTIYRLQGQGYTFTLAQTVDDAYRAIENAANNSAPYDMVIMDHYDASVLDSVRTALPDAFQVQPPAN